ncbi:MAG: hypothetical protein JWQ51_215 [Tardiphaga sp.]|nr:hypothetical protein [Tardiphaga sp.]
MRRAQRLIAATVLIALSGCLAGCGGGSGFDPTDMLDFLDTKKKLPGERKPVFPEGVPGLQQGVPKELYRGAKAEPAPEIAPPVEEPKAKRGTKSRSKGSAASRAPAPAASAPAAADPDAAPVEESAAPAVPPAPKGQKITRRRTTAPPPDQAAPAAAAPAQQPAQSAFPAPLPSSGFSR